MPPLAAMDQYAVKVGDSQWVKLGGVSWLSEDFAGAGPVEHFEATAGFDYRLRFDRTRFDTLLVFIPSGEDRRLVQLDGKLRIELVKNLDFDVTFYDRYDSKPPVASDKHDYGFTK